MLKSPATPQLLISEYSLEGGGLLACTLPFPLPFSFLFSSCYEEPSTGHSDRMEIQLEAVVHRPEGASAAAGSQVGYTLQGLNPSS